LKPEGHMYISSTDRTDSKLLKTATEKVVIKRPVDNLKLEGTLQVSRRDDYNEKQSSRLDSTKVVQKTVRSKYSHNKSSITLGEDNAILKTTNQMNFVSGKQAIPAANVSSEKPVDGLVVVSTKKVTTVIGGRVKKEAETEYVKRQERVNVIENVAKTNNVKNIVNVENKHDEAISMTENRIRRENKMIDTRINASSHESSSAQFKTSKIGNTSERVLSSTTMGEVTGQTHSTQCKFGEMQSATAKLNAAGSAKFMSDQTHSTQQKSTAVESSSSKTKSSSSAATVSKHFHHRRSDFTADTNVTNSVFHRKSISNDSNQIGSLTSNGKIHRKSILNLHEEPSSSVFPSERQSYSSIHRQSREQQDNNNSFLVSERRHFNTLSQSQSRDQASKFCNVHKTSSSSGIEFPSYSKHSERTVSRRNVNQSSISLGIDGASSTTLYRSEYKTVPSTTCAIHKIKEGAFQHTRNTNEHKFFKTVKN
ncbi:uncharacterized protein LOC125775348, partial [Bactrocera dorsalis]|uniref:Uncharacterized protein LOC125775348 n=1 Tax=Bactrocera dorsalis TaxID=27457 RepID=A0ABM3K9T4_BACDO